MSLSIAEKQVCRHAAHLKQKGDGVPYERYENIHCSLVDEEEGDATFAYSLKREYPQERRSSHKGVNLYIYCSPTRQRHRHCIVCKHHISRCLIARRLALPLVHTV